ncbi:hypothetical protein JTE90_004136 [Oedothorax gibbosus]|uniref:Uncharacterized protein n=1 Tax=Oedothorax gibbosus TaxID=931172 RepID=A0AAV6UED4_9ARAC|nr:hypothetical protein JTE90_004136 [Oedothorax gibbosus]
MYHRILSAHTSHPIIHFSSSLSQKNKSRIRQQWIPIGNRVRQRNLLQSNRLLSYQIDFRKSSARKPKPIVITLRIKAEAENSGIVVPNKF